MSKFNWNKHNLRDKSCKNDEKQEEMRIIYDIELKKWEKSKKSPYVPWSEFIKRFSFEGNNFSFGWIDTPKPKEPNYSSHKFIETKDGTVTKISCSKCGYILDSNTPMKNGCSKDD